MSGERHGSAAALTVRLLGPLEVTLVGRPVALASGRVQTLMAVLAISAGRTVSVDRLVQMLWADDLPANARRSVQTYIARLRGALRPDLITTSPAGYALRVEPDAVDALRFARLLEAAAEEPGGAGERARLGEALELWRGTPFEGMESPWLRLSEAPALVERYLAAVERRIDLDIADGLHGELVAELEGLTAQHPLRESLWMRLLLVLDRCGRHAESLERYGAIRERIADELGVDPGPELQQVHVDLLAGRPVQPSTVDTSGRGDALGRGPIAAAEHMTHQAMVPRQLPTPPVMFTGRATELADLERTRDETTVVINAIGGMAGVGKTALAVQYAHRLADHYPDGQLFIDLRGHTKGMAPMDPGDALDRMLRSLGVPGKQIPADVDERAGLFRSRLADRRMLILLDNAAAEAQVAPLLPGTPGCLVLVTSRNRLAGLDNTHTVSLDTLPLADAVTVFARTVGEPRVADQREAVVEVVELCGRLPLAIRIAAARLRSHPAWGVAHLIERLREHQHRLTELEVGERSVTAALDLSYRQLTADQRRAYRLLSLHPGSDFDAYATAALTGTTLKGADRLLDRLLEAHLLQETTPGRLRFHDLIRAHATHTATTADAEPERRSALTRLVDYYRHATRVAMDIIYPYESRHRPHIPTADTPTPEPHDRARAMGWLEAELPNLLAAATHAADHGWFEHVPHLAETLHEHLRTNTRYADAEVLHDRALTAARINSDRDSEATALIGLGDICRMQGRYEQAVDRYNQSLVIVLATGHQMGELRAVAGLGEIHMRQRRIERASDSYRRVLELARATGYQVGELRAMVGLGDVHMARCRLGQAADSLRRGRDIARAVGDPIGEFRALIGLGDVYRLQARREQAMDCYRQVLDRAREMGNRNWQFEAEQGLGRVHHTFGHPELARACHRAALDIAIELAQLPDQVRAHDGLAQAHSALAQRSEARRHWQQALSVLIELGNDHTEEPHVSVPAIRARLAELDQRHAKST